MATTLNRNTLNGSILRVILLLLYIYSFSTDVHSNMSSIDTKPKYANERLQRAHTALQAWKETIYSDPQHFTSNWVGPDVCQYNGVYCAAARDDPNMIVVAGIDLSHADISGHLPDEIGLLTDLTLLRLNGNRFCGVIPDSFSKLTLICELDMSKNRFVGPFPTVVLDLPQIHYIDLRFNEFEGPLPREVLDKFTLTVDYCKGKDNICNTINKNNGFLKAKENCKSCDVCLTHPIDCKSIGCKNPSECGETPGSHDKMEVLPTEHHLPKFGQSPPPHVNTPPTSISKPPPSSITHESPPTPVKTPYTPKSRAPPSPTISSAPSPVTNQPPFDSSIRNPHPSPPKSRAPPSPMTNQPPYDSSIRNPHPRSPIASSPTTGHKPMTFDSQAPPPKYIQASPPYPSTATYQSPSYSPKPKTPETYPPPSTVYAPIPAPNTVKAVDHPEFPIYVPVSAPTISIPSHPPSIYNSPPHPTYSSPPKPSYANEPPPKYIQASPPYPSTSPSFTKGPLPPSVVSRYGSPPPQTSLPLSPQPSYANAPPPKYIQASPPYPSTSPSFTKGPLPPSVVSRYGSPPPQTGVSTSPQPSYANAPPPKYIQASPPYPSTSPSFTRGPLPPSVVSRYGSPPPQTSVPLTPKPSYANAPPPKYIQASPPYPSTSPSFTNGPLPPSVVSRYGSPPPQTSVPFSPHPAYVSAPPPKYIQAAPPYPSTSPSFTKVPLPPSVVSRYGSPPPPHAPPPPTFTKVPLPPSVVSRYGSPPPPNAPPPPSFIPVNLPPSVTTVYNSPPPPEKENY